jgi:tRNA(Ile)-lysidine synthase TilS/MesJ
MHHESLKICSNCILPETFPGLSFDDAGVCNHCRNFMGKDLKLSVDKKKYEQKFLALLDQPETRNSQPETRNPQPGTHPYDILMAYSGGKDSTYTLNLLKRKYKLDVLAVSFDNGFISRRAVDRKSTRLNSSHNSESRMPSSA